MAKGEQEADGLEWLRAAGLSPGGAGWWRSEAGDGSDLEPGSQWVE